MISSSLNGAIISTIGALMFAINILIIRKATIEGNPFDAVMATVWINVLVFVPLSIIFHYPNFSFTMESILAFSVSGVLGTFLGRICFYSGTKKVGASRATPISQGNLLVATIFGVIVLGEPITEGHFLGISVLLAGVVIVSYEIEKRNSVSGLEIRPELLLPFGAMILFGLEAPFGKIGLSQGTPVLAGLAVKSLTAFVLVQTYFIGRGNSPIQPFETEQRRLYLFSGLAQTAGFAFIYSALSISRVVIVVPFRSLSPLFVMLLSYLFLRHLENITRVLMVGAALVIAGGSLIGLYM